MIRLQLVFGLLLLDLAVIVSGLVVDRHVVDPVGDFVVFLFGALLLSSVVEALVRELRQRSNVVRHRDGDRNRIGQAAYFVRMLLTVIGFQTFRLPTDSAHNLALLVIWCAALLACGVVAGIDDPGGEALETAADQKPPSYLGLVLASSFGVVFFAVAAGTHNWGTGLIALITTVSAYAVVRAAWSHVRAGSNRSVEILDRFIRPPAEPRNPYDFLLLPSWRAPDPVHVRLVQQRHGQYRWYGGAIGFCICAGLNHLQLLKGWFVLFWIGGMLAGEMLFNQVSSREARASTFEQFGNQL